MNESQLPERGDLIRMGVGIIGIGSSGPLIAISAMPVPTLIFWRNLGGSLFTLPFALKNKLNTAGVRWALIAGVILAAHFYAFFLSMRLTSVATGTALAALQPIFAALFLKLTGDHIPSKAWLGMFISFTGVVLISGIDLNLDRRSFLGDISAVVCAALAALYVMCGSRAQKTLETTSYTTICYGICALVALPISLISGYQVIHFAAREWIVLLGLIVGAQLLGHSMFNAVLKRVSPAVVSLIVFFEVPVAAILALVFHIGKQPTLMAIPGIAIILLGCALVVLRTRPNSVMIEE